MRVLARPLLIGTGWTCVGLGVLGKIAGSERGPAQAVPPGGRSDQHQAVPRLLHPCSDEPVRMDDTDADHIDQGISVISTVESKISPDHRNANAVAVSPDSRNHVFEEVPVFLLFKWTEIQRKQSA